MNWNISAWCIRNPIPPIVFFLLLTAAGITALFNLGIESSPDVELPEVSLGASLSGAAPSEIEVQVTRPLEDAVAGIANVKHVRSNIEPDTTYLQVTFELGTNPDTAVSDVRDAVTRLRSYLPKGCEPWVQRSDHDSEGFVMYTVSSSKRTPEELGALLDSTITRAMTAAPSVGKADAWGAPHRRVSVDLDPVRLEAFGVTADTVNQQLRALNVDLPGGRSEVSDAVESIRTLGSVHTLKALRSTRINTPSKKWVELGELGTISDENKDVDHLTFVNGKPSQTLYLSRKRGKNVVQLEHDCEVVVADLEKKFPDLKFVREYDSAKYVRDSCSATFEAMILGALLACLVVYLFLRDWRASLVAALAMPLSVIPTFAYLQSVNFTLNNMSLLGLALVIGILVDDAIVEIENIVRHMNLGKKPYLAAIEAADEIGLAVVATTMAAVAVFLPVAFMGGVSGLYYRQFGWTVSIAVLCSLLVARLITPVMAAYWLKDHKQHTGGGVLAAIYERALTIALKHRWITLIAVAIFFGASVALFQALPTALMSRTDTGNSYMNIELPPGTPILETSKVVKGITDKILASPDVETVFTVVGEPEGNKCRVNINLKPREARKHSQDEFEANLRPQVIKTPGARVTFGGGWGSSRVDLLFTSYDPDALQKMAQTLIKEIREIPELTDVRSSAQALRPEIKIEPDFAQATEQGVSVESIARTAVIATVGDTEHSNLDFGDERVPILVRIDPEYRKNLALLSNLKVLGSDNKLIPISSVAKVRMDTGISSIERYDRARQVSISAKYSAKMSLGQVMKRIKDLPAYKSMPPSISDHPTGAVEDQQDMFGGFGYAIVTGVFLIYSVLVILFRGFFQPLTIMMSLPLSLGGALVGLWLLHKPIDMYALIGIVMLMGLVTKNAILLVEYCLVQMKAGMPRREAIFQAGRTRMRPILMTTAAMIAGMLPIAIGFGAGAEERAPMAIAVVGGLFVSTLLTLVVVPVVFALMDDLEKWLASIFHEPPPEEGEPHHQTEDSSLLAASAPKTKKP